VIRRMIGWCHCQASMQGLGSGVWRIFHSPMPGWEIFTACPLTMLQMHERRILPSFRLGVRYFGLKWSVENHPFRRRLKRWDVRVVNNPPCRWLRLCSLRTNCPPDLWFLTTLQPRNFALNDLLPASSASAVFAWKVNFRMNYAKMSC